MELIPELDADYIILQLDAEGGAEQFKEVTDSPLWKNVPAVQKNNIFSPEYWLYKSWGTIGREEIVDEVLKFIK
ncbi:MAG: ABC transporter substrate-binding protein [Clostridia bacterium]|nr:ABC transporter substrate-binding protein [Clostridia bacterium]